MKRPTSLKGFTLIELLIVIVIIGILSAGAVALFGNAQGKARDAKRQNDLKAFETAINVYATDNAGALPADQAALVTGGYLQKAITPPSSGEVYCLYTMSAATDNTWAIGTWLEAASTPAPFSVGNAITITAWSDTPTGCDAADDGAAGFNTAAAWATAP